MRLEVILGLEISKKVLNELLGTEKTEEFYTQIRDLKHPHILQTYHYNEDEKNVLLVVECAKNGCLRDLLKMNNKNNNLNEEAAFSFFIQSALALEYLHSKDIVHGDFKIDNILLTNFNNVKICDFGYVAHNMIMK